MGPYRSGRRDITDLCDQTDSASSQVVIPFGFGLSYSSFKYSGLSIPTTAAACDNINLTLTVQNTGSVDGDEVCPT
jgi:hypothetical protein